MSEVKDSTHIRIRTTIKNKLEEYLNFELKTPSDIIEFLMDIEAETRELRQEMERVERSKQARELLAQPL